MNWIFAAFGLVIVASAIISVFGKNFRMRILSNWVTSLTLAFLFLTLKNELLAFTLALLSTVVTWVVISQTLIFGDFQQEKDPGIGWRSHLVPALGSLMFLGIVYLGTPPAVIEELAFPEANHVVLSEFGAQAIGRYFLLAIVISAVSFAAVVGIGMIARADWRREGEDS